MFDSGTTVKNLIDELRNEVDIAVEIEDGTYLAWLNALEQMLYSEIIKEQRGISPMFDTEGKVTLDDENGENEAPIRFEDIHTVYVDGTQLIKSTVTSGIIFDCCYFKHDNLFYVNVEKYRSAIEVTEIPKDADKTKIYKTAKGYFEWHKSDIKAEDTIEKGKWERCGLLAVMYFVRPRLKETAGNSHVMVPIEFLDLVKAKLRGEAYKVASEFDTASVWLNDYNVLLEQLKLWIAEKNPSFGL